MPRRNVLCSDRAKPLVWAQPPHITGVSRYEMGQSPNQGQSLNGQLQVEARHSRRLTSGGKAVTGKPKRNAQRCIARTKYPWNLCEALAFTLLLILLALPFDLHAQETPAENWSQFRGNHRLSGVSDSKVPAQLKLLWTFEGGESIESSAAIIGGTVFVGTQKNELVALSLDNGSVYWRYQIDAPIGESSPAYSDGVVYVGDLSGWLHAVNSKDGKKIWAFKTGSEIKSSPVVVGDRVLIGSYDENLYCVSTRNGSLLWRFKTNGPVHSTPGVLDGVAYIAGCDELFRGIRISDGKEMFSVSSEAYTGASPALRGNSAFYGTFNNEILMVNLTDHTVAWRYEHPQRKFPFYSSAAVTANRVVVGGRDKLVHGLSPTGKAVWTFTTRARVESSPAIADGRVFVGSNDGRFYVLNVNTGAKVWEFNAGAPISASPAIANGRIVVGSQDGRLYCFG
jgi:eukaryotic-like serine/threonine-protein kinase